MIDFLLKAVEESRSPKHAEAISRDYQIHLKRGYPAIREGATIESIRSDAPVEFARKIDEFKRTYDNKTRTLLIVLVSYASGENGGIVWCCIRNPPRQTRKR